MQVALESSDRKLAGQVAVITGGGKGIGTAIARRLATEGATIVVADIASERAEQVAATLSTVTTAMAIAADVSDRNSAFELIRKATAAFARVDILVNNAGIAVFDVPFEEMPEEQWRRVLAVNLDGVFFCTQAVVLGMKERQSGRIINIGALGGKVGAVAAGADYAASKGGVLALTKYWARVLAPFRITVNAVVPGPIGGKTMAECMKPESVQRAVQSIPLGRLGTPEDVAHGVAFFASPEAEWITGEVMDINGGFMID